MSVARGQWVANNTAYVESLCRILGGSLNGGGGYTIPVDTASATFVFFVDKKVYVAARANTSTIVRYEQDEGVSMNQPPSTFTTRFDAALSKTVNALGGGPA